jgi:carbonic anhydrase/acetyltransferase-like protein (isoleucine patch superfamily)
VQRPLINKLLLPVDNQDWGQKAVRLGAIVVIGTNRNVSNQATSDLTTQGHSTKLAIHVGIDADVPLGEPLACVEVVGRSTAKRIIDRLLDSEVSPISVLVEGGTCTQAAQFDTLSTDITVQAVTNITSAVTDKLAEYSRNGIEHSFVHSADVYAETDLLDLFYFHREARQAFTCAFDHEGLLPLWVADCAKAEQHSPDSSLGKSKLAGVSYFVRGYVNRLNHPRDLRRLAADTLRGRCEKHSSGQEISPGVWLGEGADVHRGARIVGPAYIGCGAKVLDGVLLTRLSSIERDCRVDCGTVIEDSSILANTEVGMWLDICHAVVKGNKMLSLERNVMIEISDTALLRRGTSTHRINSRVTELRHAHGVVSDCRRLQPTADTWQFVAPSYPSLNEE